MIRVGRCTRDKKNKKLNIYPSYENFTSILIMHYDNSKYYDLSPYVLKDEYGRYMENVWQFAKCYKTVPKVSIKQSKVIIWEHDEEIHLDDKGNITPAYLAWREKGMNCRYPIRYPVGFNHRTLCQYALADDNGEINYTKLDYIQGRKIIYGPVFDTLVKKEPLFYELKERLNEGENLLIIEVDGPHGESLDYYKEKYNVADDFIENNTMLVTQQNIDIMLNDDKHPFGHGYCLAMALLDMKY